MKKSANSNDLTKGTIWKKIAIYAVPLLIGGFLQQLYNAVDAIVVGKFVSSNALAAVGSVSPIIFLMVALLMGLSVGSTVVIANYFGKKDDENLSKAAHTAIVISVVVGILLTVVGVSLTPALLKLIDTPAEIYPEAKIYLQVFFSGMMAFSIYNIGASILQAVGNTRYPLYFLMVSTVLNIVLDLFFVVVLDMGVEGASLSTIIAEAVSAILVLIVLFKSKQSYKLSFKKMRIDKKIMKRIISIGIPSAIQTSIVSFSNIFVLSYINSFGATVVAGFATEGKIESFLTLPMTAIAMAITTFVSQNLGAGEEKRARRGVWIGMIMTFSLTVLLIIISLALFTPLSKMFTSDGEVIDSAWIFARVFFPGYVFLVVSNVFIAALRGAGRVKFAMFSSITCFVIIRQIYLAIVTNVNNSVTLVALGFPMCWGLCALVVAIYFFSKNRITARDLMRIHIKHSDGTNTDFLSLLPKIDEYLNQHVPSRAESGMNSTYNADSLKDVFLMYDDENPIGTACIWQHDETTCEILRMFVDEKYRNKGYGKQLISEIESYAKSIGYKKIILRSYKTLPTADQYENAGFQIENSDDFAYTDKFQNAATIAPYRIYMTKEL